MMTPARTCVTRTFTIPCVAALMAATVAASAAASVAVDQEPPSITSDNPIFYDQPAREIDSARALADGTVEAMNRTFMQLHTSMQYREAAEMALRLAEILPDNPTVHYNLACVMARLHRIDDACDAFEQAIELGWRNVTHTRFDSDLHSIRSMPRFVQAMRTLNERVEEERIRPRPLRDDSWDVIVDELSSHAPQWLSHYRVPGMAVALVERDHVVWSGGFGHNGDIEQPMTAEHAFRLASPIQFFALLGVLEIEHEGGTELEALIAHLRDDAELDSARRGSPAATQRQVGASRTSLSHRRTTTPGRATRIATRDAVTVFQLAVEMHRDQSFAAYCRDRIFQPAGMVRTSVLARTDRDDMLAVGHTALGSPLATPTLREAQRVGAVQSTAADLGQFVAMMMDRHAENAIALAQQEQRDRALELIADYGRELGLSVHVSQTSYGMRVQMADEAGGMGSLVRWHPNTGRGIVVLYNATHGREAALRVAHLVLGGE